MEIEVKVIPHVSQFYSTIGDWHFDKSGKLKVTVSNMGNEDFEFLVALHEIVEAWLCRKRGIDQDEVTKFDKLMLEKGVDNPGDDVRAPYHKEHRLALIIESMLMHELNLSEVEYLEAMNNAYLSKSGY